MTAIVKLKADHDKIKKLLTELETTTERGVHTRAESFSRIKGELTVHESVEQEIFYPELKAHPQAKDVVLEGCEEDAAERKSLSERIAVRKVSAAAELGIPR